MRENKVLEVPTDEQIGKWSDEQQKRNRDALELLRLGTVARDHLRLTEETLPQVIEAVLSLRRDLFDLATLAGHQHTSWEKSFLTQTQCLERIV